MIQATQTKRKITKKQAAEIARMAAIVERLKAVYPEAVCALEWGGQHGGEQDALLRESWKLLVMGRLSAQCTDARVNIVCKELFERFPTVQAMAEGDLADIEAIVRPCGLYRTKAKNIKDACRILAEDYGGIVPDDMDALLALPGVGRKIANLLLGDVYRKGGVVTDTHCIRICGRLGFYGEDLKDPLRVERILTPLIPSDEQSDFCHRIVQFGRDTCAARSPSCGQCPLSDLCKHGGS
jgi:endonuclease-3